MAALGVLSGSRTEANRLDRPAIHPFPARMPVSLAKHLIEATTAPGATVLDPMVGSGTTLVAARSLGRIGIGVDIDPLAVLVAGTATHNFRSNRLESLRARVLTRAQGIVEESGLPLLRSALPGEDQRFLRYWFPPQSQKQLFGIAASIRKEPPGPERDLAWVVFSSLIIGKTVGASYAMDLARSRPHKRLDKAVIAPLEEWDKRFRSTVSRLSFLDSKDESKTTVLSGDARNLPVTAASVDLVLTSPPYLNAIDYLRGHKFSLVWMKHTLHSLRELRGTMVGTERGLWSPDGLPDSLERRLSVSVTETRKRAMLRRYLSDLRSILVQVHRVLKPGGLGLMVLGPTVISSRRSDAAAVVEEIGESIGLEIIGDAVRRIKSNRRSLPLPNWSEGNPLGDRMRREVIVALRK